MSVECISPLHTMDEFQNAAVWLDKLLNQICLLAFRFRSCCGKRTVDTRNSRLHFTYICSAGYQRSVSHWINTENSLCSRVFYEWNGCFEPFVWVYWSDLGIVSGRLFIGFDISTHALAQFRSWLIRSGGRYWQSEPGELHERTLHLQNASECTVERALAAAADAMDHGVRPYR